jgi:hypothetical protein
LTEDNTDEELAEELFAADVRFLVMKKSTNGFTIIINKPAPRDIRFSWTALRQKDEDLVATEEESSSTSSQAELFIPSPTVSLVPTKEATASASKN